MFLLFEARDLGLVFSWTACLEMPLTLAANYSSLPTLFVYYFVSKTQALLATETLRFPSGDLVQLFK